MSLLDDDDDLPEARGGHRRRFSLIWLVPIAAVVAALYLGYQTLSEQGPSITVTFESGDGLQAGQTPVKHKEVTVGTVEGVRLSDDLTEVVVDINMSAEAEAYLGPKAQFWVVRPRIGPSGVSGLGTLVSGAYVAMVPDKGRTTYHFQGLDNPPVLQSSEPGTEYILKTDRLISVGAGSPIFFRGIEVGEILGYQFDDKTEEITIHAFVRKPHDELVRKRTSFWNASGVSLTTDGGSFRVQIESLQAVFSGGVSFDTTEENKDSPLAPSGTVYTLFPDQNTASSADVSRRRRFLLYFPDSVAGLSKGASVELRGIKVGEVLSVQLELDAKTNQVLVPVVIDIEVSAFKIINADGDEIATATPYALANALVERGLRAQLKIANILIGTKSVALEFFPNEPKQGLGDGALYPVIPTKPTPLTEVTRSVTEILNEIAKLPLSGLVQDLRNTVQAYGALAESPDVIRALKELDGTLASARQLMATTNRDIGPVLSGLRAFLSSGSTALDRLSTTLTTLEPDSPLQRDLRQSMVELRDALRSIRVLADFLEAQPDALLRGRIDFNQDFGR